VLDNENTTFFFFAFFFFNGRKLKKAIMMEDDQVAKQFRQCDSNGDGTVSLDELSSLFASLGVRVADEELTDSLHRVDLDGSGELDLDEFRQLFSCQLRQVFDEIDSDRSGAIGKDEFRASLAQAGYSLRAQDVDSLLAKLGIDSDGDGVISFAEFSHFYGAIPDADLRKVVARTRYLFENLDSGSDLVPAVPFAATEQRFGNVVRAAMAGGIGGTVSRVLTAPLERVKIAQQVAAAAESSSAAGTMRTVRDIVQREGVLSLWRGNLAACLRVFPFGAVVCVVYSQCLSALGAANVDASTLHRLCAGAAAGAAAVIVSSPLDVARAQMSVGVAKSSLRAQLAHSMRTGAMFRGLTASLAASLPFIAIQQTTYDVLRAESLRHVEPDVKVFLGCGVVAGVAAQLCVHTLDTYRRLVQVHESVDRSRLSLRALYRGLTPALLKVAPGVAVAVVLRDKVLGKF
jgi:solute carrier family 25 (mitochondrial phosphate transporter), member 23/24/25/41